MSSHEESNTASCSDDYTDISDSDDTESSSGKEAMSMQEIIVHMLKKRKLSDEQEAVLSGFAEPVDYCYDNNKAVDEFETITDDLKVFAIFLYYYSPGSYKYILENYHTPLPTLKVLQGLYENHKYQPGFTKQSFDILAKRQAAKGSRLICSLVADGQQMFIDHSYADIDVGAGPLGGDDDGPSEAYFILLVSLEENWKIPVGFFIADHTSKETQAELIKMTLSRSYEVGVDVVSITQPMAIAELLGCRLKDYKKLKTTFKHPECNRRVAVFIDPTLSLRSVRNKFQGNKELLDEKKRKIRWELIDKLEKMHNKETLFFDAVPYADIVKLRNVLAKIDLVAELFTLSLSEALELCKNRLKLPEFKDAEATIEFITIINTLFDVLHSKTGEAGFKQPICRDNAREILEFLEAAKNYISTIHYFDGKKKASGKQLGVLDASATGFRGFLISIESLKHLYTTLVEKENVLDSIATHRLAWDQIEDYFEKFRRLNPKSHGGKFQPIYKSSFKKIGSDVVFIDRAPIQSYPISNVNRALDVIKRSAGKRSFDNHYSHVQYKRPKTEDDTRADSNVRKFSNALYSEQDQIKRKQMVGYIAGWMVVQLARVLRCEGCIDALFTDKKMWFHKLITLKELSGVCLPSEELFRVCWECERAVRSGGGGRLWAANDAVLRRLLSRASQLPHSLHPAHQLHLTRAIVAKYIRLRLGQDDSRQRSRQKMDRRQLLFFFNM